MITIDLSGPFVTYLIFALLGILGWVQGFRYIVSLGLMTTLAYLIAVQGGDFIVGLINRTYSNLPRLAAFLTGGDTTGVAPLGPIIPENLEAPLLLRVLVFVALVAIGIGYTFPWKGKPLSGWGGNRPLRILGALTGLYTAVLLTSAAAIFWREFAPTAAVPDMLATALNSLPTWTGIIPSTITAFVITLLVVTVIRFNRIWAVDSGGGGGGGGSGGQKK
ncbi:MAG: hypothetical protein NZ699_14335 [Roseiflexus sp.]|nr:hypothetical protein [Roseiflexus sp.]MCS7290305.1 hypothetical protein [Roseiflexus sp.]MDW8146059.1 hypothetical protein [Roseiflexaceae bacterium]MDW8231279.1 hypothetical protein [Roseiflexaceae bacterium]